MRWLVALGVTVAMGLSAWAAGAGVIYEDDFDGSGDLNGTAPDVRSGTETWRASPGGWQADGSISDGVSENAWLPFEPEANRVYELSLHVDPVAGNITNWFALGFAPHAGLNTDFFNNAPAPWMINRVHRWNEDTVMTFTGPGVSVPGDGHYSVWNRVWLKMTLNTCTEPWIAEWLVNDVRVRGPLPIVPSAPLRYVGFGRYKGATGRVYDFRLSSRPAPAAANEVEERPAPASRPEDRYLHVDLDSVIQPDFLGVNGVYHGFAFMPEQVAKGMDDADRAREFGRIESMRLNIARTWYRADWACGDSLANPFDWRSEKMEAFCRWLEVMQELNVDIALQSGWWARDTHMGMGGYNPERDKARYAEWVSESLRYLIQERGFTNIKYLVLFTEPHTSGGHSWEGYVAFVREIDARLKRDGLRDRVKTVGPNNSRDGRGIYRALAELNDVIDIYSGHEYHHNGYEKWLVVNRNLERVVADTGKPVWVDEYNSRARLKPYAETPAFGNDLAQMVVASMNAGNQTSMIWLLFDQQYVAPLEAMTNRDLFENGVHRWGTCRWPRDDVENATLPYPSWYAFSMMSRHLGGRNGTPIYRTEASGVFGTATSPGGKGLSVVVINPGEEEAPFTLHFSGPVPRTLSRYLFDPAHITVTEAAEPIAADRTFEQIDDELKDTLPPLGVAIYTTGH